VGHYIFYLSWSAIKPFAKFANEGNPMGLYAQMLTETEIDRLQGILTALFRDKPTGAIIGSEFRGYLKYTAKVNLHGPEVARTLHHLPDVKYEHQLLMYDYIHDHLAPMVANGQFQGLCPENTAIDLAEILKDGRSRVPQPWGIDGLDEFTEAIDPSYLRKYFGYRMSASYGNVIRFHLEMKKTSNPKLFTYENAYRHLDEQLTIRGTGRQIKDTLYLVGHATDRDGERSSGMRFMALRPIGTSQKFTGIVLTFYEGFPIAARALLVPSAMHVLPSKSDEATEGDIEMMTQRMLDQKIEDVIGDMKSRALDDIRAGTLSKVAAKRTPEETLSTYIDNTAPTVLKAGNELTNDLVNLWDEMASLRARVSPDFGKDRARELAEQMAAAVTGYIKRLNEVF
jgi:hypothetical protein